MTTTLAEHPLLRLHAAADNAAMQTEPSKADPSKLNHRRFQFRLRPEHAGHERDRRSIRHKRSAIICLTWTARRLF